MFLFGFLLTFGMAFSIIIIASLGPIYGYGFNFLWFIVINGMTGTMAYSPSKVQTIGLVWLSIILLERTIWLINRNRYLPLKEIFVSGSALTLVTSAFTTIWLGGLLGGAIIGLPLFDHFYYRAKLSLWVILLGKLTPYIILLTFYLFLVWGAGK